MYYAHTHPSNDARFPARHPQTIEAAGELLRGEVGELVERQGVAVLSLSILLHVLLNTGLVVLVHLLA